MKWRIEDAFEIEIHGRKLLFLSSWRCSAGIFFEAVENSFTPPHFNEKTSENTTKQNNLESRKRVFVRG
tara:strand:- start:317 stop:523 length:207 start_codon:yes stop_codon:yes gene_type:complete